MDTIYLIISPSARILFMKKIVLTGGGTAGHVTPNIALIPALKESGYEIFYIGSKGGIEEDLIKAEGIPFYGISSGKLRRYFSLKNFTDPFRVIHGMDQAARLLRRKIKPDVIFSKGGFVSVPVVEAASVLHIPVVLHESDMTPGLANKLMLGSAAKICCNFPETIRHLPKGKAVHTGTPIRQELLHGDAEKGLAFAGLSHDKPIILIMGGSQGAAAVNDAVRHILPALLEDFSIVHLCGQGKLDSSLTDRAGYVQMEYVSEELKDLFAACDLVISRAGANAICEIAALKKPNLLIPLSLAASRGDQILNAQSFERQGISKLLLEENVTDESLLTAIRELWADRQTYIDAMHASDGSNSIETIVRVINEACQ